MYRYKLSFQAEEDIVRIFDYGSYQFGINQAIIYYDMLFACFEKITTNPLMFPVARQNDSYRICVCGVDTIYYKIGIDEIEIITIIGRQNF